jgi:hypothetical protein
MLRNNTTHSAPLGGVQRAACKLGCIIDQQQQQQQQQQQL